MKWVTDTRTNTAEKKSFGYNESTIFKNYVSFLGMTVTRTSTTYPTANCPSWLLSRKRQTGRRNTTASIAQETSLQGLKCRKNWLKLLTMASSTTKEAAGKAGKAKI